MAVTDFIVAIELGSTKIIGLAGRKRADGCIQILAHASEHSSDCIRKGVIYNSDKTLQCLTSIIRSLEEQLGASIKKAYVGIGGKSMYSVENRVFRQFNDETKISLALTDSMMKANREMALPDKDILEVVPQEYLIGKELRIDPVGISTDSIEGHYLNIIARRTLKDKIKQCFKLAKCEIAGYIISPVATAEAVLTSDERRSGCALVDLGAETTTVAIYKNNILRHLAVIPLGSNNVTKDISSDKQIDEEDAEELKLRFASAYTEAPKEGEKNDITYSLDDQTSIKAAELEEIVEARIKEIILNVENQIKFSHYSDKLLAGIVITGGGANMPNIDEAFKQTMHSDKVRIAKGSKISLENSEELPNDGTCNTIIGVLSAGKDNCCKIDPTKSAELFSGTGNDLKSQQEMEEEKRRQEEEERRRKEAEAKRKEEALRLQKVKECEALLEETRKYLSKNKYDKAQEQLELAIEMNVSEKQEEIDELKKKMSKKPKTFVDKLKDFLEDRANKFSDGANKISKDLLDE